MTRDEALTPFKMLSAAWPFLRFEDDATYDLWYEILKPYLLGEVREGVKQAISEIDHTPSVAEVLAYVKNVRENVRRRAEEEAFRMQSRETILCRKCNDHGFITIVYPKGYESVRVCDCETARRQNGENVYKLQSEPMPRWKEEMLFGANEIPSQYELVRVSKQPIETNDQFKGQDHKMHNRVTWAYVPYFPRSGKEEVIMQYQRRRKK